MGRRGHGHGRCEKAQLLILATTRAKNGEFGDGQKIVQLIGKYVNGQRIRQLTGEFVDGQTIGPLLHSLANPLTDRKLFNSHIWNSLTDRQSVNSLAEFIDGQTIGQLSGEFVDGQTICHQTASKKIMIVVYTRVMSCRGVLKK